jgi:hypothetical protein
VRFLSQIKSCLKDNIFLSKQNDVELDEFYGNGFTLRN